MIKKEKQFIEDMTRYRGITFARLGMMVHVNGHPGTIVGMNSSANLDVLFANRLKFGNAPHNVHPTDGVTYFGADGAPVGEF